MRANRAPSFEAASLAQLGNPTRLRIVRALVKAGDDGMAVGEIQRALEVYELTGAKLSSHHSDKNMLRTDISILNIGLFPEDRSQLHNNIAKRFDAMLNQGIVEELMSLRQKWQLNTQMPSMRCIGYRQVWRYIENEINQDLMRDQAIAATRQLAKRQLTWLRHYPGTKLIDPYTNSAEQIEQQIIYQLHRTNC